MFTSEASVFIYFCLFFLCFSPFYALFSLTAGLNNVIRELTHSLYYLYGANKVYGITGGFHGFHKPEFEPILLTNDLVENIHHDGGTVLRSSRGGFDIDKILAFLKAKDISQLYIIGGDGTHRGAYAIHKECVARGLNVAVAGLPKTSKFPWILFCC